MSSLVLGYKNFAANRQISHIGLGVAAINTSKTIGQAGMHTADVWPIVDAADLRKSIESADTKPTHVVVSAPWIPTHSWQALIQTYPRIKFAVNCHSNVGFLQADSNGVRLFREGMDIEMGSQNFRMAGNSDKFCHWVHYAYDAPCAWLPNLYYLDSPVSHRPLYHGGTLRIGAFGATRPLKNLLSAVGAAIVIGKQLKAETELWMSSGRTEGGGDTILNAAKQLAARLPHITLKDAGWNSWPQHRRIVGNMHLLLQPSYTESFNMVTADGIAEGVPSVVSDVIDWAPQHWIAKADDVMDIARVGRSLLSDPHAHADGLKALQAHNTAGLHAWNHFLN